MSHATLILHQCVLEWSLPLIRGHFFFLLLIVHPLLQMFSLESSIITIPVSWLMTAKHAPRYVPVVCCWGSKNNTPQICHIGLQIKSYSGASDAGEVLPCLPSRPNPPEDIQLLWLPSLDIPPTRGDWSMLQSWHHTQRPNRLCFRFWSPAVVCFWVHSSSLKIIYSTSKIAYTPSLPSSLWTGYPSFQISQDFWVLNFLRCPRHMVNSFAFSPVDLLSVSLFQQTQWLNLQRVGVGSSLCSYMTPCQERFFLWLFSL